jgi:flagellar motor switch protein FliN/FliY
MANDEKASNKQPLIGNEDSVSGSSGEALLNDKDMGFGRARMVGLDGGPSVKSVELSEFDDANILTQREPGSEQSNIDMILDISIPIAVELGRTTMFLKDVLTLAPGSIVELNKLAGDTVDLMIRGKLIAKGEVVVVDDNFGMRITSICGQEERLKHLT